MQHEWDWPPRRPQIVIEARVNRQEPPNTFWSSPLAKRMGNISLGSTVFAIKAILAITLGLLIASALWMLELLLTTKG